MCQISGIDHYCNLHGNENTGSDGCMMHINAGAIRAVHKLRCRQDRTAPCISQHQRQRQHTIYVDQGIMLRNLQKSKQKHIHEHRDRQKTKQGEIMPEGNSGKYSKSHKAHTARPDQAGGQHQPKTTNCPVPHGIEKAEQQKKGVTKSSQRNTNIEVSIPYRIQKTLHT